MRTFVRAYTADADIWCMDCAAEAYGEETDVVETTRIDDRGVPYEERFSKRTVSVNAVDREGNPVNPVFSWDLTGDEYCGSCLYRI